MFEEPLRQAARRRKEILGAASRRGQDLTAHRGGGPCRRVGRWLGRLWALLRRRESLGSAEGAPAAGRPAAPCAR
jgi:hypothetical protein